MGDQLHRDAVGPRAIGGKHGKLAEVGTGQQSAGGVDLLFDEVEVIEQPFPSRGNASATAGGRREQLVGVEKHTLVVGQSREQPARLGLAGDAMETGDRAGVPLELLGGE